MKRVFRNSRYVLLALASSVVVFIGILITSSLPFVVSLFEGISPSAFDAAKLAFAVIVTTPFEMSAFELLFAVLVSLLIGMNVSLLTFFTRLYRALPRSAGVVSSVGSLGALLGAGCAACGSVFLVSLLSTIGGSGFLALLPYGGEELRLLGLGLLITSSYVLVRSINRPPVCPI